MFLNVIGFFLMVFRVIECIFSEFDKHIEAGDLISEYRMSALPGLYDHFVKLIKYLVNSNCTVVWAFSSSIGLRLIVLNQTFLLLQLDNKQEDRDQLVILLQDMLEVVTKDIMMEDEDHISRCDISMQMSPQVSVNCSSFLINLFFF